MTLYRLAPQAETDLADIYRFGRDRWGRRQARRYLTSLEGLFHRLCENPDLGRERPDLREGYRSLVHESHVIFYRVRGGRIDILRVLHAARDVDTLLGG